MDEQIENEISAELHLFKRVSSVWEEKHSHEERKIMNEDVERLSKRIYELFKKFKPK